MPAIVPQNLSVKVCQRTKVRADVWQQNKRCWLRELHRTSLRRQHVRRKPMRQSGCALHLPELLTLQMNEVNMASGTRGKTCNASTAHLLDNGRCNRAVQRNGTRDEMSPRESVMREW